MPRIQKLPVCHTPWLNFQYFDAIFHNTVKHYTASCTHTIVLEYDWWLSCKRQGCLGTWACFASIWQFRELVVTVVQETRTSRVMGMLYSSLVWMHKEQELCFDFFSCLWTHTATSSVINIYKNYIIQFIACCCVQDGLQRRKSSMVTIQKGITVPRHIGDIANKEMATL